MTNEPNDQRLLADILKPSCVGMRFRFDGQSCENEVVEVSGGVGYVRCQGDLYGSIVLREQSTGLADEVEITRLGAAAILKKAKRAREE